MSIQVIKTEEGGETRSLKVSFSGSSWPVTSREIQFLVMGAGSKDEAFEEILRVSPVSEAGLPRQSVRFDGFEGEGVLKFTVSYEAEEQQNSGSSSSGGDDDDDQISFDSTGGTTHIMTSRKQDKWQKDPDPGGMIGWNGKPNEDAEYAGVDIVTAQLRESYTKTMSYSKLSTSYRRKIAYLTGTVNASTFKGWKKGEVLFLGASFSGVKGEKIAVTFNFAIQQNESGMKLGNGVTVSKNGWDYAWTITKTRMENGKPKVEILNAFVDQVYRYEDFGALKI